MAVASSYSKRVVALVDMDCFYVQVVQRKDPSLKGIPCAVVQYNLWKGGGIIAVGYEAREFGVTRQMRGDEAKRKCPEIKLVQVPENRGKADLTQFRDAAVEVFGVLADFTDCLERASVDEGYMDLTNAINRDMQNYQIEEVALDTFKNTHLVGLDNKSLTDLTTDDAIMDCDLYKEWLNQLKGDEECYRLAIGAVIANKMRLAVRERTGFSCSAGVGPNKMLAKIVAGFHKPNQQTLILPGNVEEMFASTKMRKIRSLGGKLGAQLEEKFRVEFMSQLVPFSLQELQAVVGVKNGNTVYWLCRGVDLEPVRPRQLPQSVGCGKNFRGKLTIRTKHDVYKWLTNLCEEIVERLEKEKLQNERIPTLFTVGCTNEDHVSQSRRCNVIKQSMEGIRDEAYKCLCEFNTNSSSGNDWSPAITNLNLTSSKFVSTSGSKSINSYMNKTTTNIGDCSRQQTEKPFVAPLEKTVTSSQTIAAGISKFYSHDLSTPGIFTATTSEASTTSSIKTLATLNPKHKPTNRIGAFFSKVVTRPPSEAKNLSELQTLYQGSSTITIGDEDDGDDVPSSKPRVAQTQISSRFLREEPATTTCSVEKMGRKETMVKHGRDPTSSEDIPLGPSQRVDTTDRHSSSRSTIDTLLSKHKTFSNNKTRQQATTINDLMICERCGKRLLAWDLPDHMDFHFAKDLQDSLRENFFSLCGTKNNSASGDQNKKRTASSTQRDLKKPASKKSKIGSSLSNNSLSKYFSPTKKQNNEL